MNIIFQVPKKRHFLLSIFWSILIVTLVMVFLLLSFTLGSVVNVFRIYSAGVLGASVGYNAGILMRYITPFVLVLMTFTAIYIIMPRVRVSWRNAFAGSLFVTVLWEVAKHFFAWYVSHVVRFGTIYGSLTTFILFLLWVFYSSCIFLLGAEFVNHLRRS